MKIIITMAGLGSRFKDAGYEVEKYEIMFHGKTLFEWAIESLQNFKNNDFIFITRDFKDVNSFINEKTKKMGIKNIHIKIIPCTTKGQAETVLFANEFIKSDESLIIYNIDTYVNSQFLRAEYIKGDGWIPVFFAEGDKWSFVEANEQNLVLETAEKMRISDNCSIGLYYFSSYSIFESCVNKYYNDKNNANKEWYIAPLYNVLINEGYKIYMHQLPKESVIILGTPEDLITAGRK